MPEQNGIIGDAYGTQLPQTQVSQEELNREKNLAQFSKTKEYQLLKDHLEGRIEFYKSFLPDGRPITDIESKDELAERWLVANSIIGEFKAVIDVYENAATAVKEAN